MPMPIKNISKHKYTFIAVAYTLWLSIVSLTPLQGIQLPSFANADKIVHFFLYFFLVIVWLKAYPPFYNHKFWFLSGVIVWGIIIEFLQETLVPGRSGDFFDALANSLGAVTGLLIFMRIKLKTVF